MLSLEDESGSTGNRVRKAARMRALFVQGVRIDLDRVVADLRAIEQSTAWERTMRVGKVVFDGVFAGDADEWRTKRSNKQRSLRKLVTHPQCPFKKSALSAAVNVFLFVREHPEVRDLPGLTPTHVNLVCSIPAAVALELLSTASQNGWSIRELADQSYALRLGLGERRGRPRTVPAQRAQAFTRRCLRSLEGMQRLLAQGLELDPASSARLFELLESVGQACVRTQPSTRLESAAHPTGFA